MLSDPDVSFYALFHNDHRYIRSPNDPCSHIFSGIVRKDWRTLALSGQDYDGKPESITTDIFRHEFNLAVIVPVPRSNGEMWVKLTQRLNNSAQNNCWPFYFSRDMKVKNHMEIRGVLAVSPEGAVNPPRDWQEPSLHTRPEKPEELTRARVNCVRMALLTARLSGIKVENIENINPLSTTGEEIRDRVKAAVLKISKEGQRNPDLDFMLSLSEKKGREGAHLYVRKDGVVLVHTPSPTKISVMLDAFERKRNGRDLFDVLIGVDSSRYVGTPLKMPEYLTRALEL